MNVPFTSGPSKPRPLVAEPVDKVPWRINLILLLVGITVLVVIVSLPSILTTSSTTSTLRLGTDLQGCRSLYNAEVTDARTRLDLANAASSSLQDQFLTNLGSRDAVLLGTILKNLGLAQMELDAAAKAEAKANNVYQRATKVSNTDQDKFLDECTTRFKLAKP